MDKPEGILLVNKTVGKSSFSIVSELRKLLKISKIGHTGTLDPLAQGLMVMLIGKKYTKLSQKIINEDKEYIAQVSLGENTDTFDSEMPLKKCSDYIPTLEEIKNALSFFQGEIKQLPPMFSAKKVNGKRLYSLARKGLVVERTYITVYLQIELINYSYPLVDLKVTASKGAYIRVLANDLGEKLGTGAYLKQLIRTRCGKFLLKDAIDQDKMFFAKEKIDDQLLKLC